METKYIVISQKLFSHHSFIYLTKRMGDNGTNNGLSNWYNGQSYQHWFKYVREDYEPSNNLWFITITLSPKLFKFNAMTQYEATVHEVRHIISTWGTINTIAVELTEKGNVHYHALCKIESKLHKLRMIELVKRKKCLGFMQINSIPVHTSEMLDRSCNYLIKSLQDTRAIMVRGSYKPDLLFFKNV